MHKSILFAPALLIIAGCAVGPSYQPPRSPAVTTDFRHGAQPHFQTAELDAAWWSNFGDPMLDELMTKAHAQNFDLAVAAARLEQSRARLARARWNFAPSGGASFGVERGQDRADASGERTAFETWSAGGEAWWEIDLFGRQRRSAEKALALTGVAAADLRAARVALAAELASSYVSLRAVREIHAAVRGQQDLVEQQLGLVAARERAGHGSRLERLRLEQLRDQTAALLPGLAADEAVHLHRVAVLLGESPSAFHLASPVAGVPLRGRTLAIASPEELLRRRPDIAAAERNLAAATAQLGVSTAEMFPQVSIRGALRFVGFSTHELGASDHRAWSVAPTMTWNVFDLGRLQAARRADQAGLSAAAAAYQQVVLRAIEDVENSLARYTAAMTRMELLASAHRLAEEAQAVARAQHEAGAISSFEALEAQRAVLEAQREFLASRLQVQLALVSIYRAMAGGWLDAN